MLVGEKLSHQAIYYLIGANTMKDEIHDEIDRAIFDMEMNGVNPSNVDDVDEVGLGDMVEGTLKRMGITEDRFKQWFNLKECKCSRRKEWLNNVFSWKKGKPDEQE
jgi:hypothetical protein